MENSSTVSTDGPDAKPVVWTLADAERFLAEVADDLTAMGVTARVVGSVATKGFSRNDLDLLLAPTRPMSLEAIMKAVESEFLPKFSTDSAINPLPSGSHEDEWFLNIALKDGRIVELYLPEACFPVEP